MGKYEINYMLEKIEEYIGENKDNIPILKECCFINNWDYDYVMKLQRKHERLRQSTKRLLDLKEIQLEKGGLSGKIQQTMAIFSLKQLGWRDKVEFDMQGVAENDALSRALEELAGELDGD